MTYTSSVAVITALEHTLTGDDELVAAAIAGEEDAFGELFLRHKRMVAAIGGRFFPDASRLKKSFR